MCLKSLNPKVQGSIPCANTITMSTITIEHHHDVRVPLKDDRGLGLTGDKSLRLILDNSLA